MAQLNKGTTYSTGDQVTAANLNALVDNAILQPGAITEQIAASSLTTADSTLLSQPLGLRKATLGQILSLVPNPDLTSYLKADGSVAMTTGQQLTLGSTTQIAPLNAVSLGHLQANYTPLAAGTIFLKAQAIWDGVYANATTISFLWTRTATQVTINCNNHGFIWLNKCYFTFTGTNAPASGVYTVNNDVTTNTFTIDVASGTAVSTNQSGSYKKCAQDAYAVGSTKNISQINPMSAAGGGYWINFNRIFFNETLMPTATVSRLNASTAAWAVFDEATTGNVRTLSSVFMKVYTSSGVAADSGFYTSVTVAGPNSYAP